MVCEAEVCVLSLSVLASMRPYACRDEGVPLKNALTLFMDLQLLYISWCKNTANTVRSFVITIIIVYLSSKTKLHNTIPHGQSRIATLCMLMFPLVPCACGEDTA